MFLTLGFVQLRGRKRNPSDVNIVYFDSIYIRAGERQAKRIEELPLARLHFFDEIKNASERFGRSRVSKSREPDRHMDRDRTLIRHRARDVAATPSRIGDRWFKALNLHIDWKRRPDIVPTARKEGAGQH